MLVGENPEAMVPADHPVRPIKRLLDQILRDLSPLFEEMYAQEGRPAIPPERLLKARFLHALDTIRSEAPLVESLRYNLLYRWFLDLNLTDPLWDPSVFPKNQQRLLTHRAAEIFFARRVALAREHGWVSDEHFPVAGTLIEAWASLKSFAPKEGKVNATDDDPGNPTVDFKGEKRRNATRQRTTDPEARLRRKSAGRAAKLCLGLHALMENRHGLCVQVQVAPSVGTTETEAARDLLNEQITQTDRWPASAGADKACHNREFVGYCREQGMRRTWRRQKTGPCRDWTGAPHATPATR
jgi:transposase